MLFLRCVLALYAWLASGIDCGHGRLMPPACLFVGLVGFAFVFVRVQPVCPTHCRVTQTNATQ
eukprot:5227081-Pyramimonas_sp.AAC.1